MKKIDLKKYIGKDYAKYNCFDLVKEFYKDHFDVAIKDYFQGEVPDRKGVESLIISNKGDFVSEQTPIFGDIVVIKLYGIECHIGVVVNDGMFLHSAKGIGSNMERLARYKHLIAGYYRHRGHRDSA